MPALAIDFPNRNKGDKANADLLFDYYVESVMQTDDREFPLTMQHKMTEHLKADNIKSLPGGHLPMLIHPEMLAEIINEFIRSTKFSELL